ncbi:U3 snoRNA-associated small subunit rRNA processing protein, putative [Plasmodium relictum]|uniref:U3 snoRNA-associated small subunit rRNA processing protein, putative n=1 Tax=Plasmodium relictum TaxID=85471 RepID=A0A1J1H450_PLARL|nr:U3 snoRNA-associated small subunit rRNA processing protein, putative [Plasmodium relictum]CRG99684.1 U3 snoRNA-associated small subunit rRNA processing protein, putative [Plasmodium relictum]
MPIITNIEIENKFFDFYEGDENVFYSKEYELFLSLCNNNIYAFKVENIVNCNIFKYNILYPTCILESCVDIDDVKEFYHKKYLNKYCISLFSNIRHFYYSSKNIFLSTDDNNIHYYVLMLNDEIKDECKNENEEIDRNEKDIYLYDHKENEGKNFYSYSYNWVCLKKMKIWKTVNIVISCFYYSEVEYKKLVVGYNNGLINIYNLNTYKLKISYKIHNSRITNLKMYKNFIISSDVTKNVFIYDSVKGEKIISCEDHMSGIKEFLFLAVQSDEIEEKKSDEYVKNDKIENENVKNDEDEGENVKNDEDEKLIGFISIGNDKIMNVWNLNILNSYNEEEINNLKSKNNNKKKKKDKNNNVITFSPIKQIYLSNDINNALIIPSSIYKNKKGKLIINDENIKWLILTHDDKGNLLFYNPLKGEIIYKFKENKMLINASNIRKFFLLKNELYIFREDNSILIYDIRNFKLINNYICKLEGIFEILFFDSLHNELSDEKYKSENEEIMDKNYDYNNKKKNAVVLLGDNIIRILKFENLISQTLLIGHEDVVSCIKLNEKNNLLFSASNDKNIFIWNLKNCECLYVLKDNLYPINSIDVNLKKFPLIVLVSVCEDNSLKLWKFTIELNNIKNNKKKRKLDEHLNDKEIVRSNLTIYPHKVLINDVAISPNSKIIATCSKDKTIKLFETQNLKLLKILEGHKKSVQNIFFSKNENILYSNSYDCVRIWNLSNYACVKSIQSLDFNITRMLILNDNCIINGYSNGNISIINIKSCEKLSTINYHKDKIFCLKDYNNSIVSASINGELIFFKNTSEEIYTENVFEKRKNIFYENCLESLLKEKKINESLLICLKLDKKFKFKSIIENYLNYYTFSILNILKKFEHEYGVKKINEKNNVVKKEKNDESQYPTNQSLENTENKNSKDQANNLILDEKKEKNIIDDNIVNNIQNYIENSDILENYIYYELSKLSTNESEQSDKDESNHEEKNTNKIKKENEYKKNNVFTNQLDDDDNFVLFLKKIKKKSEHSYFLYLNKLMEYITFFVMNHRYAYISNFLLNSLIKYIDYSDICKINNYQHFFEIYNSYIPRHKNRYLKSLQKSKCFELININYYKGDIKMMI